MYQHRPSSPLGLFNDAVTSATLLSREDLAAERELLLTKWFPYRFISPMEATMQFAAAYRTARADFVFVEDPEGPEQIGSGPPFVVPNVPNRDFTAMWRVRQQADAFCIPYELYLEFCFQFAGRRKRRQVLQPNQCRPSKTNYEWWFDGFQHFLADRASAELRLVANVPQYDVRNHCGLPAQADFLDYLEQEMVASDRPWQDLIGMWSLERSLFPLMRYRRLVKPNLRETLARCKATVSGVRKPAPPDMAEEHFRQACYGLPGAYGKFEPQCRACPQIEGCRALAARVEQEVKLRTGHLDPVAYRKREQGRLRKRRLDANIKERAAGAMAGPEVTLSETII